MPRRPNDETQTSHVIPIAWYFCPVETCRRALSSKSSYTRHIRSVHSDLDIVTYNTGMPQPTNDDQLLLDQAELQLDFNPTDNDQQLLDQTEIQMDFDPSSPSSDVVNDYEVHQRQSPLLPQPTTSSSPQQSSSQVPESNSTQRPSFRLPKECLSDRIEYHSYIYG
jgi:hypothetical protein